MQGFAISNAMLFEDAFYVDKCHFASTGRQTKYTLQQIIGAKNQFFTQHSDSKMNFKILHSLLFLLHSEFNWN